MHIKDVEELNKVVEELSTDQRWININSEVKQKVLNEIHEDLALDLLSESIKKSAKPKRRAVKKKQEADSDDGENKQ